MNVLENVILIGFLGSLVAGLGTAIGAAGVFGLRQLTPRSEDLLLSSAAGVMLAAAFFSLIEPGLVAGELRTGSAWQAAAWVIMGIGLGRCSTSSATRSFPRRIAQATPHPRRSPCWGALRQ